MSAAPLNPTERKIIALASIGGMLEFYDFVIYGIFSVYFAPQFFPSHNQFVVIMESYLLFVLGYIARPVGGILFSHIGDEHGRKKVLIITIVLMGIASGGIGLIPTYATIGMAAPILLLLLRLMQGLALGGELPSTYVYISESIEQKRGIAFGIVMAGVNGGLLLGMLINQLLNHVLTTDQLMHFGWRLPFIFGGLLCFISYRIRKTLHETAVFQRMHDKPAFPLLYLFRHHFATFLAGTAIASIMAGLVVVGVVFMPTYLQTIVKLDSQSIGYAMTILMIVNIATIYLAGEVTQRIGPQRVFKALLILCCFFIPIGYFLISHGNTVSGLIVFGVLEGIAAMIAPVLITLLFESNIRLTGVALCYNIGFTVFGGLGPLIITHLIKAHYNVYWTPCLYLLTMVFICGAGLTYVMKKRQLT